MATDLTPIYQAAASEWNVDPNLLQAVAGQETGGTPSPTTAVSPKGATGLMQIMPATGKELGVTDPTDPAQSIFAGAKYLSQMLDRYKKPELALAAYNAGPQRVDDYLAGKAQLPAETMAYVPGVGKKYQALAGAATPAATPSASAPDPFTAAANSAPDPFTAALSAAQDPAAALSAAADPFTTALTAAQQQEVPAPSAAPAATAAAEPTVMDKIGAGLVRAGHDMTDVPAEYLAKGADAIGLTGLLNRAGITAPTAPQTVAADTAGRHAFNENYGDSPIAGAARIGGQVAGTLPLLATGGGVLGAAGDVAAAGAGRIAPWLGRAAEGTNALLSGETGGGMLARGASLAANGAVQGGAAGALTAGQSDQSVGSQALSGAGTGFIAGPVAGAVGAGLRGVSNALTGSGGGASPEVAKLAQLARDTYGIPINAPQMSTNSLVRIANDQSSKLPFSGAAGAADAQQSAWQRAVSHTFGEDSDRITPDVMDGAAKRIGGVFNDVANRTNIAIDQPLKDALAKIETEASSAPLGHGGQDAIKAQIDNILGQNGGQLTGQDYQQLTRAGAPLQRAQSAADPNVRFYAGQVRDALDSAFQRSAAPEDQAALSQARGQWRAMKTVEDLAEKSTDGNISPALLMGQVRGASSRFDGSTGGIAYTGGGQLGDLARIGQQFMKPQPNSGTPDRVLINSLLGGGGVAAGIANPLAAAAVPAGLAANRLAGAYLRSGGYANRVINSSLNPNANPLMQRLIPYAAPTAAVTKNALVKP